MNSTVLITGSAGRIGRLLMQHWADRKPMGLDRAGAAEVADLAAGGGQTAFVRVGTVVHLAANPDPGGPFTTTPRDNMLMTLTVLEHALLAGVQRLIYASSVWTDARTWRLSDKTTWYGASKIAGEALVEAWADQTGCPAVCLRIGGFQQA